MKTTKKEKEEKDLFKESQRLQKKRENERKLV